MAKHQWADPEVEYGAAERLTFFSDAVVAIAITLLALELPVPTGKTPDAFWHSAWEARDEYLAFVISFLVIAAHWSAHHAVFRWIRRSDRPLRSLNLLWLFALILNPFVTKVISEGGDVEAGDTTGPLRFGIYAAVQVLANLAFLAMMYRTAQADLLRADVPANFVRDRYWDSSTIAIAFAASIPLFYVWSSAWILWIFVPVISGFVQRVRSGPEPDET